MNSTSETISLGDYNINHCNWTDKHLSKSGQTYKLRHLIEDLFTRIFPYGVRQLISGPTRHFPGQRPSGLDHLFTNIPDKITSVQKHFCGGSDHMLIMAVRLSRSSRTYQTYVRK